MKNLESFQENLDWFFVGFL